MSLPRKLPTHLAHVYSDCRGFTLIELMVALVLGLTVIGGAIAAFGSASRSAEINQSMSQIQANARFALDSISTDIRMAGFQGCASTESAKLTLSTTKAPVSNFASEAITATVVGVSNWKATLPDNFSLPTGAGAPAAGTHLLRIQYAAAPGYRLDSDMSTKSSDITVTGNASELISGQLAVISNCDTGDLFEIDSVGGTGNTRTVRPAELLAQPYLNNAATANTTRVMPFVSSLYYIGDTTRLTEFNDPVRSLYLQTYPFDAANNPPVELIEGVDQLQLSFGVWQADNSIRFVAPGDSSMEPRNVGVVHIGLLMASASRHLGSNGNRAYTLAGKKLLPEGSTGTADANYPDDKRIRVPFSGTVKVRNRFPENRS